jgi:hypothetical protein
MPLACLLGIHLVMGGYSYAFLSVDRHTAKFQWQSHLFMQIPRHLSVDRLKTTITDPATEQR